jgi:hypothetical protein
LAVTGDDYRQDDFPQHDHDPVADALSWARVAGLRVIAVEDRPAVWVRCTGCGAELGVPVDPWWPRRVARRIRAFVARHHRHR